MNRTSDLRVTYFLDVTSSWCWWAEPAWIALKDEFRDRATFDWKIALMDPAGYPTSRQQCDWFYRRSGVLTRSGEMLNSGWWEAGLGEYLAANLVPEAARDLGFTDDRVRLAVASAGLREGRKISDWNLCADVAASVTGLPAEQILERARSPEVEARVREDTRTFHSFRATQRPTFVLENRIGDRAMVSGLASTAPLRALAESMLSDVAGYASFAAHFGEPPK